MTLYQSFIPYIRVSYPFGPADSVRICTALYKKYSLIALADQVGTREHVLYPSRTEKRHSLMTFADPLFPSYNLPRCADSSQNQDIHPSYNLPRCADSSQNQDIQFCH